MVNARQLLFVKPAPTKLQIIQEKKELGGGGFDRLYSNRQGC